MTQYANELHSEKAPIVGDWWTCISCEKPIRTDGTCSDGCPYDGKRDISHA